MKIEEEKLFEEFRGKFGFKTYDAILKIFYRLHIKIGDLIKSRDNWKNKYLELKKLKP